MKEYLEKQKKIKQLQNMYANNQAMNPSYMIAMNPFLLNQFKNMNMPNLKNMPINSTK